MTRRQCGCGRVMYVDVHRCPTCGRPMSMAKETSEPLTECEVETEAEPDALEPPPGGVGG